METEILDPGDDVYAQLDSRLLAFNRRQVDWDGSVFVVVLRAPEGHIVGGARGIVRMGAVEIRGLWIDEDMRGRGLGRRIIQELEAEARKRGATSALLDTYGFQAREFYEQLGYACFGVFDYPNSMRRFYMTRSL